MRAHHAGGGWISDTRREAIYQRDNHACVYCGSKCSLTIDHIDAGSNHRASNLVTACRPCNGSKGDLPLSMWLSARGMPELEGPIRARAAHPLNLYAARAVVATRKREKAKRKVDARRAKRLRSRWR